MPELPQLTALPWTQLKAPGPISGHKADLEEYRITIKSPQDKNKQEADETAFPCGACLECIHGRVSVSAGEEMELLLQDQVHLLEWCGVNFLSESL